MRGLTLFFLTAALAGCLAPRRDGPEAPSWEACRASLAARVERAVAARDLGTVAVLPFRDATGRVDALTAALADELRAALAGRVRVVGGEDERFGLLLDEVRRAHSGLVDEATAPRVGRLLAASAVLTGTLRVGAEGPRLVARLTVVETGEDALGLTAPFRIPEGLSALAGRPWEGPGAAAAGPLEVEVVALAQGADGETRDLVSAPRARPGEAVQFRFRAEAPCHGAVLWRGSSGRLYPIFPVSGYARAELPLEAGRWYRIPEEGHPGGGWIAHEGPAGTETLWFVFSRGPLADLGDLAERVAAGEALEPEGAARLAESLLLAGSASEEARRVRLEFREAGGARTRDPGPVRPGSERGWAVEGREARARSVVLSGEGRVVWRLAVEVR